MTRRRWAATLATAATAAVLMVLLPATPAAAATALAPSACADADMQVHDHAWFLARNPGNPLGAAFALAEHQEKAAKAVACLTNAERAARGLPALAWSDKLRDSARGHARSAAGQKWWVDGANTHVDPKTPRTHADNWQEANAQADARVRSTTPCSTYVGDGHQLVRTAENDYHGWGDGTNSTAKGAVQWWMNSDSHRAAILNPQFNRIGVGVVSGAGRPGVIQDPAGIFVQHFAACT